MMFDEGIHQPLQPYDWRYYCEKLRKEQYDLNDDIIRPYFSLDNVRNGIFTVCEKLYGITFKEKKSIPTYHAEATAYEVIENGNVIAILYLEDRKSTRLNSSHQIISYAV